MIKVGQKVKFDPFSDVLGVGIRDLRGNYVFGTVVYVHRRHRWFLVEYGKGENQLRTAFSYWHIGNGVKVYA